MRHKYKRIGLCAILLGLGIILALILPPGFWFFFIGSLLIICGFFMLRK